MYIWIGINVNDQLLPVGKKAKQIENEIGFPNSNFTLPLHVSLKISFPIEDALFDGVIRTIEEYYSTLSPFVLAVRGIEDENTIVWIRMERNEQIDRIHDDLNRILLEKYGVPLHEYDTDYQFHTTLFMDGDTDKINAAYAQIKDVSLPKTLTVNRLLIGCSPSGALGTYKVYREYFI